MRQISFLICTAILSSLCVWQYRKKEITDYVEAQNAYQFKKGFWDCQEKRDPKLRRSAKK